MDAISFDSLGGFLKNIFPLILLACGITLSRLQVEYLQRKRLMSSLRFGSQYLEQCHLLKITKPRLALTSSSVKMRETDYLTFEIRVGTWLCLYPGSE